MDNIIWHIIGLALGVYVFLIGIKKINPSKKPIDDPSVQKWYAKYGKLMLFSGLILILWELFEVIRRI